MTDFEPGTQFESYDAQVERKPLFFTTDNLREKIRRFCLLYFSVKFLPSDLSSQNVYFKKNEIKSETGISQI